jgi:hypothetical protein
MSNELNKLKNNKDDIEVKDIINNYKTSNYNWFVKYDNNSFFGYNFLNRSILRIPLDIFPFNRTVPQ